MTFVLMDNQLLFVYLLRGSWDIISQFLHLLGMAALYISFPFSGMEINGVSAWARPISSPDVLGLGLYIRSMRIDLVFIKIPTSFLRDRFEKCYRYHFETGFA